MRLGWRFSSPTTRGSAPGKLRAPGAAPFGDWALNQLTQCGLSPTASRSPSMFTAHVLMPTVKRAAQLQLTDCPPAVEFMLISPLFFRAGMLRVELAEILLRLNLKSTPGCWGLLPSSLHDGKWVVFRHLLLDGCTTTASEFAAALRTATHETELLYTRLPERLRVGG